MTTIASILRKLLPAAVAVLLFFTLAALYFAPQFGGDVLPQHDVRQYEGASREVYEARAQYGEDPQWIGSMFGGMPAYLVNVRYPAQLVKDTVGQAVRLVETPAGFLFFAMCAMWAMLLMMGINPWVGIVPSLAYGLSTYFILIIGAGHVTKMWALVYAPLMMGGIWMTLRGRRMGWGAALTALFASLEIGANHPQITYYFLLAAAFFWISEGIFALREKMLRPFAKRTAVLVAAGLLALGSNFAPLWYTAQYAKDTTRSGSELAAADVKSDGLDLAYATAWSYGRAESWNLLIPDFMGSDSGHAFSADGPVAAALTPYGMAQASQQIPAYWGDQPYTGGPTYLGAAALFLALLGALLVGGRDRWWLVAASVAMLLLAWGHHFMGLTELAYNYLPGYNKFRTVSMALVIVQWTVPLLAALALQRLWRAEIPAARLRRALAWAAGVTGGVCLLFAVAGGHLFDFGREAAVEQMTAQFNHILRASGADDLLQQGLDVTIGEEVGAAMAVERAEMMTADAWRSLLFVLLTAGAVGAMIVRPRWRGAALALAGVLVVADLWGVDARYLSSDDFVSPRRQQWTPSEADKLILRDTTPGFRVLNLTVSPFNDATTSYYHRSVGGYHGAKMSRYQDVVDRYLAANDEAVLDLLNTRYLILPDADGRPKAQLRPTAQGAAWLVNDIVTASTPQEELAALATADLRRQAVVNPADYARMTGSREGALPVVDTLGGTIRLAAYRSNYLKYEYASPAPVTAVFSEIFYDKGWTAYVDGAEAPYFRADYLLRAMELPAGNHTVEWRFRAPHWGAVEGVTGLCSAAILLAFVALAGAGWYKRRKR